MSNSERVFGTVSRGVRAPIIKEGDNIAQIVVDTILNASEKSGVPVKDKDIIAITESVVGRAQGNYATVEQIAEDIRNKFPEGHAAIVYPILSRNRFSVCLKGIASGLKKLVVLFSYPSDEVGNHLVSLEQVEEVGLNPNWDVLTEKEYRSFFGHQKHQFTGVDYVDFYRKTIEECGCECEIYFSNNPCDVLDYEENNILVCDIHTRQHTKKVILEDTPEARVFDLTEVLSSSVNGSGYNAEYGLLGSNKATEDKVKLFPRLDTSIEVVFDIFKGILGKTGKSVEVLIYGDGAFKDPVGKIWELADPVVGVAYTEGLVGTPNELKLKYLADNDFSALSGDELKNAISDKIKEKQSNLVGKMISEGTTPRQYSDLVGSLCDLTSGSGDKGTPIVWIQGYFDNYTTD